MVWVTVVALLQASVMVYVLVNVIGQEPVAVPSTLVTTKLASVVQLSDIVKPAASNATTVVNAAGASAEVHPLAFTAGNVPAKTGAVVSLMLMVWVHEVVFKTVFSPVSLISLLFGSAYSVIVKVRITFALHPGSLPFAAVISTTPHPTTSIIPFPFPNAWNWAVVYDVCEGKSA